MELHLAPKACAYCGAQLAPPRSVKCGAPSCERRYKADEMKRYAERGCWEWNGRLDKNGYGKVRMGDRTISAHRLVMGEPDGPVVHHVCANRACCNPDHLQLVTHRENTAEMMERQTYLRRIATLESALASAVPDHPLLRRNESA